MLDVEKEVLLTSLIFFAAHSIDEIFLVRHDQGIGR